MAKSKPARKESNQGPKPLAQILSSYDKALAALKAAQGVVDKLKAEVASHPDREAYAGVFGSRPEPQPQARRAGRPKGSKNKPTKTTNGASNLTESQVMAFVSDNPKSTDGAIAKALGIKSTDLTSVRAKLVKGGKLKNAGGHGRGVQWSVA